jgi:hypothetical protein
MCLFCRKRLKDLEDRVTYLEARQKELTDWASLPEPIDPFARGKYVTPLSNIVQALLTHLGIELKKRPYEPQPEPKRGENLYFEAGGQHERTPNP